MHSGKTPPQHAIEVLLARTAPAQQLRIRALDESYVSEPDELAMLLRMREVVKARESIELPDPRDFDAIVRAANNAFEGMRYGYEAPRPNRPPAYMPGQLLRAARAAVLEIHPEWTHIKTRSEQLALPTRPPR